MSKESLDLLGWGLWGAVGTMMVLFGLAWWQAGQLASPWRRAVNLVAAFNLVEGIGLVLVSLRGELPFPLGYTLACAMVIVAWVLMWRGASELLGLPDMRREQIALLAVSGVLLLLTMASPLRAQHAVAINYLANAWVGLRAGWHVARKLYVGGSVPMAAFALVCAWGMGLPLALWAVASVALSGRYDLDAALHAQPVLAGLSLLLAFLCNVLVANVVFGRTVRALNRLNELDPLTGLSSSSVVGRALAFEWRDHSYRERPLAILALAVDGLSAVRATHGAGTCDLVIAEVALELKLLLRPGDVLGHEGDGRFLVILPNTDTMLAKSLAQFAVLAMARDEGMHPESGQLVTLSIGVALRAEARDAEALLRLATSRRDTACKLGGSRAEAGEQPTPVMFLAAARRN